MDTIFGSLLTSLLLELSADIYGKEFETMMGWYRKSIHQEVIILKPFRFKDSAFYYTQSNMDVSSQCYRNKSPQMNKNMRKCAISSDFWFVPILQDFLPPYVLTNEVEESDVTYLPWYVFPPYEIAIKVPKCTKKCNFFKGVVCFQYFKFLFHFTVCKEVLIFS